MNSKSSETSDPHRLLLNLTDNKDLRRKDKYIALSNLGIYYIWENMKYQPQHGLKNLNCLMDNILYQIFKIILNVY